MTGKSELKKLIDELEKKGERLEALLNLSDSLKDVERRLPMSFNGFLNLASRKPRHVFRNVFQLFYDMVHFYIPEIDEDTLIKDKSIGFVNYNSALLFEADCDDPFFADRLFTNRFMKLVGNIKQATQNNRIFLFEGPPGSGKSTFLNILLQKLEKYSQLSEGTLYETFWRLDVDLLGGFKRFEKELHKIALEAGDAELIERLIATEIEAEKMPKKYLEFSCPNHDHPIIQIPKSYRKQFLEELIPDKEFLNNLFSEKEYEWVFKDTPCSICSSIYEILLEKTGDPLSILNMIYSRKARFSRQFGEGISVFNPGDPIITESIKNSSLQGMLNDLLKTDAVAYIHSFLARTNNGVLALMDIKENNIKRLMNLHGIISDGVHKVGYVEERIKTLFVGLINPADKQHYEKVPSFRDRVVTVDVPYVLDYKTEVAIYKNKFGSSIEKYFLPRILENLAKVIIGTRLNANSEVIKNWLQHQAEYTKYTDKNYLLLKIELYAGKIPDWLNEEDVKNFDTKTKRAIFSASKAEGKSGISGRQSLYLFNSFINKYEKEDILILMDNIFEFYNKNAEINKSLDEDFINSLVDQYDYNVLQEMRESIYYFNKKQISKDIINYMYCVNFEHDTAVKVIYTGDKIEITDEYFKNFEAIFLGATSTIKMREAFRKEVQSEYVSKTLTDEIQVQNTKIDKTRQFKGLYDKYTHSLKENALLPYIENESFRRAVKDYGTSSFKTYDGKLKRDVEHVLKNLVNKFNYTPPGAKQIALYVLDKKLPSKF
ncbi:MAG: serine protein kinase PrkA [Bacteroidetes bacterium]|nr:MAG: serine protein kinase PrkA [Bacteroidota bacterium]